MSHEKQQPKFKDFQLLPGERIVNIEDIPSLSPTEPPSGLRELYRLARAKIKNTLYEFNPPLASLALETNKEAPRELRLYEALFGRDSLRVGLDVLPLYPQLTRATIITLAAQQGMEFNAAREEEPGRIPHEIRSSNDPIAIELTETRGWGWPYYGSVDATPEFIRTIAAYCREAPEGAEFLLQGFQDKNGMPGTIETALTSAVDWLLRRMSDNPEGLIESKAAIPGGIENQVWKDSYDAYFHKDGTIANHANGVASIEVQRLAYDALLDAADLYETPYVSQPMYAEELRASAEMLHNSIFRHFWTDDQGGYFVLGTDRNNDNSLNQLKLRTSNMGHVLHSRLLEGDDPLLAHLRESVVRQLFSPELLTPSGIRTLASDEVRYRPGAYHNGSIWLWDTHLIAKGLRRQGYYQLADTLGERLFKVVDAIKGFPEFVRGEDSPTPTVNRRVVDVWDSKLRRTINIERPPQQVQAWTVGSILALKHYNRTRFGSPKPEAGKFEQSIIKSLAG